MMPLFVELCAGTAAVSLRLHRDGARPPVSRMGAKTGYADTILRVLGLVPGERAAAYLWCEPDPGVRLLLEAYRDADLARAAAAIIRGWAGEDPRALWERLRAEGPPRCLDGGVEAGEVARWAFVQRVSGRGAAWGATCDLNGNGGCDPRTGQRFPFSLIKNTIPIDEHGTLPALIHPDARAVDPGPALPPGTVAYLDGPYENTTQYANLLPRSEQVALARRWAAAGATVCISEAEAIPELVVDGWHAVRIDGERIGTKRTFSRQQAEWLTLSRPPAWTPSVQAALFGGAR
jgi:hypothetical protein